MNCCDSFGQCTQGDHCPARGPDMALVARIKASYAVAQSTPKPAQRLHDWLVKCVAWGLISFLAVTVVPLVVLLLIMIGQLL